MILDGIESLSSLRSLSNIFHGGDDDEYSNLLVCLISRSDDCLWEAVVPETLFRRLVTPGSGGSFSADFAGSCLRKVAAFLDADFAGSCLREAAAFLALSSSACLSFITIFYGGGWLNDVGFVFLLNGCSLVSFLPLSVDVFVFRWSEFR
ncbi:Uncharacterized protein Rs2_13446 [Raphanus sativus]|nr:Uncharacterized protein Rs2_13446 [Raphanus sativus]